MTTTTPLLPGHTYHIYNRGNNRDPIFFEERNYRHFLKLYTKYIHPIAATYAYCLLRNHFHFLLRIKTEEETSGPSAAVAERLAQPPKPASRHFNNMFIAYTKAINAAYDHTGSVFESPFRRKRVEDESYFINLLIYIHRNPEHHHVADDFRMWQWSSYRTLLLNGPTHLQRDDVLATFDGREGFIEAHQRDVSDEIILDWS